MKRKTTVTLTIAALLGLTGVLYAGIHFFSPDLDPQGQSGPIGEAASQTDLYASDYCTATGVLLRNINSIACDGTPTFLTSVPTTPGCEEMYMAIAPLVSANAGFTPRDVFITHGQLIYRFTPPSPPPILGPADVFATIPDTGCNPDHTGITFDHTGIVGFDYNMFVTCHDGTVWKIPGTGVPTPFAFVALNGVGRDIEGPAVVPLSFGGPHAGKLWVADEDYPGNGAGPGALHAISSTGIVTLDIVDWGGAESVQVVPAAPCAFCSGGIQFQSVTLFASPNGIYQYFQADLMTIHGDILVPSEQGGVGTGLVTVSGGNYVATPFDNTLPGAIFEGATFVDCDVPSPTPTATATATATATFTPTPTPTPTLTPRSVSPTPTPTPTTCGSSFVIGDLDAVVGNHVTFWGAQWWRLNHLSGGTAPASFKGFANCTNPNPPACGGTWQSDPGNSSGPPPTVPADITVIVSSLITKAGPIISGDIPKMVIVHTDPGYKPDPGHAGTGTVTAVVCGNAHPQVPHRDPVHR